MFMYTGQRRTQNSLHLPVLKVQTVGSMTVLASRTFSSVSRTWTSNPPLRLPRVTIRLMASVTSRVIHRALSHVTILASISLIFRWFTEINMSYLNAWLFLCCDHKQYILVLLYSFLQAKVIFCWHNITFKCKFCVLPNVKSYLYF